MTSAIWTGLRLVVLDVETAEGEDGHRVIQVAAVTVRDDSLKGTFSEYVNPGIPVDEATLRVHRITDDRLRHEDDFATLAPLLLALFRARAGETLVLVAHRVRFDIPVLRSEFERAGQKMPDLPLLDTSGGLLRVSSVKPASGSLAALLLKLKITNTKPHDALGDALATAEAARQLVNASGRRSITRLLTEAADGTVQTVPFQGPRRLRPIEIAPARSPEHMRSHAAILGPTPTDGELAAWLKGVEACAALRCDLLDERVALAEAPPTMVLPPILERLRTLAASKAVGATATLTGAMGPLLERVGEDASIQMRRRQLAVLDQELERLLTPLRRCQKGLCPSCRRYEPCPLDEWRLHLAQAAVSDSGYNTARQFLMVSPSQRRRPYENMHERSPALADAALRLVVRRLRQTSNFLADQTTELAWNLGCLDPEIAADHARAMAASGREDDLRAGLAICVEALSHHAGSTEPGWVDLEIVANEIGGRLERLRVRYGDDVDEDGNPIPLRRHTPSNPRRAGAARF